MLALLPVLYNTSCPLICVIHSGLYLLVPSTILPLPLEAALD